MDTNISRAKAILEKIRYATIATATKGGKPWNSPVAHEYDRNLNIYWFSDKEGQHSRNVRENQDIFIVIYDSTIPEGEGARTGLYIEAEASELNDPDVDACGYVSTEKMAAAAQVKQSEETNL